MKETKTKVKQITELRIKPQMIEGLLGLKIRICSFGHLIKKYNQTLEFLHLKSFYLIKPASRKNFWRLTTRGVMFLKGELSVPITVQLKKEKVISESTERIKIGDLMGVGSSAKFSFSPDKTELEGLDK